MWILEFCEIFGMKLVEEEDEYKGLVGREKLICWWCMEEDADGLLIEECWCMFLVWQNASWSLNESCSNLFLKASSLNFIEKGKILGLLVGREEAKVGNAELAETDEDVVVVVEGNSVDVIVDFKFPIIKQQLIYSNVYF